MNNILDRYIQTDKMQYMDHGERRAKAHAKRLTKETGIPHRAIEESSFGLVGGAIWWTV